VAWPRSCGRLGQCDLGGLLRAARGVDDVGDAGDDASFIPPAGALLVALVASDGGGGTTSMTVSGGGVTWAPMVEQNPSGNDYAGVVGGAGPRRATR